MPIAAEDHRDVISVAEIDGILIFDASARLDDGGYAGLMSYFDTVIEREEGIGCHDRTVEIFVGIVVDGIFQSPYPGSLTATDG